MPGVAMSLNMPGVAMSENMPGNGRGSKPEAVGVERGQAVRTPAGMGRSIVSGFERGEVTLVVVVMVVLRNSVGAGATPLYMMKASQVDLPPASEGIGWGLGE
eukprot:350841-Chlamydomonas_euryale.AAC.15